MLPYSLPGLLAHPEAAGSPQDARRIRLVPGFFNVSLTVPIARSARPAAYIDLNVDLHVSTVDALSWLLRHGLVRRGTLIGYDDWLETPYLSGGQTRAHVEVAETYHVEFEYLPMATPTPAGTCALARPLFFRVLSVGRVARHGITRELERFLQAHQCVLREWRELCQAKAARGLWPVESTGTVRAARR